MRNIIVVLMTMMILVGCKRADSQEIILTDEGIGQGLVLDAATVDIENHEEAVVQSDSASVETTSSDTRENTACAVFVCGAVVNPGVYYLEADLRLIDAVNAAGGFTQDADTAYVNLAASVQDGLKVQIPTVSEVSDSQDGKTAEIQSFDQGPDQAQSSDEAGGGNGLVNINTASAQELQTLPGIGQGIAGRIIDYRTENGKFSSIEDIMKVSGIKDKLFSKIKDHITV